MCASAASASPPAHMRTFTLRRIQIAQKSLSGLSIVTSIAFAIRVVTGWPPVFVLAILYGAAAVSALMITVSNMNHDVMILILQQPNTWLLAVSLLGLLVSSAIWPLQDATMVNGVAYLGIGVMALFMDAVVVKSHAMAMIALITFTLATGVNTVQYLAAPPVLDVQRTNVLFGIETNVANIKRRLYVTVALGMLSALKCAMFDRKWEVRERAHTHACSLAIDARTRGWGLRTRV